MQTLEVQLRSQHPDVKRFEIRALSAEPNPRNPSRDEETAVESISVLRTGARSAVQVVSRSDSGARVDVLWFDVKGLQPVVVAARNMAPLVVLNEADGTILERDVMSGSCTPLIAVESLSHMRVKRAFLAGDALCAEYLEPRPAVSRGEAVTVRYMAERIELVTKGIARHDAAVGQRLALMNPATKEIFSGVVAGAGEVQVHAR